MRWTQSHHRENNSIQRESRVLSWDQHHVMFDMLGQWSGAVVQWIRGHFYDSVTASPFMALDQRGSENSSRRFSWNILKELIRIIRGREEKLNENRISTPTDRKVQFAKSPEGYIRWMAIKQDDTQSVRDEKDIKSCTLVCASSTSCKYLRVHVRALMYFLWGELDIIRQRHRNHHHHRHHQPVVSFAPPSSLLVEGE